MSINPHNQTLIESPWVSPPNIKITDIHLFAEIIELIIYLFQVNYLVVTLRCESLNSGETL